MAQDQDEHGFTVSDKRHFTTDGDVRADKAGPSPREAGTEPSPAGSAAPPPAETPVGDQDQIDFPSYILTYYTQGLVLLGEVPNPYTSKKEENLDAARHTIDILAMLQEKTRGNLAPEEDQLIDSVIYELRMKYMARTNRIKL